MANKQQARGVPMKFDKKPNFKDWHFKRTEVATKPILSAIIKDIADALAGSHHHFAMLDTNKFGQITVATELTGRDGFELFASFALDDLVDYALISDFNKEFFTFWAAAFRRYAELFDAEAKDD